MKKMIKLIEIHMSEREANFLANSSNFKEGLLEAITNFFLLI